MSKEAFGLVLALAFVGLLVKCDVDRRNECMKSACLAGLSPVWLNRDHVCICVEVAK